MKIIIEVGAHGGEDTARLLDGGVNKVFAFEPFPEMMSIVQSKFKNIDNFYPVPMAVDFESGWSWFNIGRMGHGETGISSLHPLSERVSEWFPGVPSEFTDRVKVMKITLKDFVDRWNINKIDYLWVDAQGNDLRVLQSLGDRIDIVESGRCEASYGLGLYDGIDNSYVSISKWLESKNFEIAIVPDGAFKEADVHFRRKHPASGSKKADKSKNLVSAIQSLWPPRP